MNEKQPITFPILMYHRVEDSLCFAPLGIKLSGEHCSVKRFESHLKILKERYTVMPLLDIVASIKDDRPLPGNAAAITFDDGTRDHDGLVLGLLLEYKLPATFFVMSGPLRGGIPPTFKMQLVTGGSFPLNKIADEAFPTVLEAVAPEFLEMYRKYQRGEELVPPERYIGEPTEGVRQMKWVLNYKLPADLKDKVADALFTSLFGDNESKLANLMFMDAGAIAHLGHCGMTIGSHSRMHYNLATINDPKKVQDEIILSKKEIRKAMGVTPKIFAYPAGGKQGYTVEHVEMVRSAYDAAVITGNQKDPAATSDSVFELPRMHEKYFTD